MPKCFLNFVSSTKSQVIPRRSSLPCRLRLDQSNLPKPCSLIISELWWFTLKIKVSSCLKELQLSPLTFLLLSMSSCTKLKMRPKPSCTQRMNRLEIHGSEITVLGLQIQVRKEMDAALISFNIQWGFQTIWKQMVMSEFCSARRIYCIANGSLNFTFKSSW